MRGRCAIFVLVIQLLALQLCPINADGDTDCTQLKTSEASWERFKKCGYEIRIEDDSYVVNAETEDNVNVLNTKKWYNSIQVKNSPIKKINLELQYDSSNSRSLEVIGNDLLTNLSVNLPLGAKIRVDISGNRHLDEKALNGLKTKIMGKQHTDSSSYIQDFGECLPTPSIAKLTDCVYVLGDLVFNASTKTNEEFPKKNISVRGCLKITGSSFTQIDFVSKLDVKCTKGSNEISNNKNLCIHPETNDILRSRFPGIILKNNKKCDSECTSKYAISATHASCQIITTDLTIKDLNASANLDHLKSVQKVRGSVSIVGNELENIDFLDGLKIVDSSKSSASASIDVRINKALKEISFPQLEKITHKRTQKAIYFTDNGNYTMPEEMKKELKKKFGNEDVMISDYQIPVDKQPEWEEEAQQKENKTKTVKPKEKEDSSAIYIGITVPLCAVVLLAVFGGIIAWAVIRYRRKHAPHYMTVVPMIAPRDNPNTVKYVRKLPWMVDADKIMADNVQQIEIAKKKRMQMRTDMANMLKIIREDTEKEEARLRKEAEAMLKALNDPDKKQGEEEKREKAGKDNVKKGGKEKEKEGKELEEVDANGEPYPEAPASKKSKKGSKKEKNKQQKTANKENAKKSDGKNAKEKETKKNVVQQKILTGYEKLKAANALLKPSVNDHKGTKRIKVPMVQLPEKMPEAVLYFENSLAFGDFRTRFDDIRKNPLPAHTVSDDFSTTLHHTEECDCIDPFIAPAEPQISAWQPDKSSAPKAKVYGIRWQKAFNPKHDKSIDHERLHVTQLMAAQPVYEMPFRFTAQHMIKGPLKYIKEELDFQEENRKRLSFGISSSGIEKYARPGTNKGDWANSKKILLGEIREYREEELAAAKEREQEDANDVQNNSSETSGKQVQKQEKPAEKVEEKAKEKGKGQPDPDITQTVEDMTFEENQDEERMKAGKSSRASSMSIRNPSVKQQQEEEETNDDSKDRIVGCSFVYSVAVYNFKDSMNKLDDVKQILKTSLFGGKDVDFVHNMINALMSCEMNRWLNFVEKDVNKICELTIKELSEKEKFRGAMATARMDVRIVGEIRGRFDDLRKALCLPRTEGCAVGKTSKKSEISKNNHIFLGNYVGGHNTNLETICLLFCMKVLYKDNCCVLRGAMEWSEMNEHCGFLHEMICRFGEKTGRELWKKINEVFSWLPLACVAGESILCVNSGIVPDIVDLELVRLPITKLIPDTLPFNLMFGHPNNTVRRIFDDTDSRAGYYYGDRLINSLSLNYGFTVFFTSKVLPTGYASFGAVTRMHTLCSSRCYSDDGVTPANQIYAAVADYEKDGELTFRVYWQSEEDVFEYDALKSVKIDPKTKSQISLLQPPAPQDSGGKSGASNNSGLQSSNNSTVNSGMGGTSKPSMK